MSGNLVSVWLRTSQARAYLGHGRSHGGELRACDRARDRVVAVVVPVVVATTIAVKYISSRTSFESRKTHLMMIVA